MAAVYQLYYWRSPRGKHLNVTSFHISVSPQIRQNYFV